MEHRSIRDRELGEQGWIRQFSASEPRLTEAVEQYRELGFEVLLEPVDLCPADGDCASCLGAAPEFVKVIYTRSGGELL
ncbi:MAG: hypothetical protein V1816_19960 [Pseudomonadota bacterium]